MRYILWDFDHTLGYHIDGRWSGPLHRLLASALPGTSVTRDEVRNRLRPLLPWHRPERAHPELSTAEAWWGAVGAGLATLFRSCGVEEKTAEELTRRFRAEYVDPARWRLYPDSLPALDRLGASGWQHILLSNHVPELRDILQALGVASRFAALFNSAETGVEKPNSLAFTLAKEVCNEAKTIWMIGDSYEADIQGAAAAGIPAILVREPDARAARFCGTLDELTRRLAEWTER